MAGKSPDPIRKTMDDINLAVAENLGYDLAHVWVFEEVPHEHF